MRSHRQVSTRWFSGLVSLAVAMTLGVSLAAAPAVQAAPAPVGQGFTVTPADLAFILKQIKIAERHSRAFLGTDPSIPANPDPTGDPYYCQSLVGSGAAQIPDRLTAYGLRTVEGNCNNLFSGRESYAAADQPFPRLTSAIFRPAEPITPAFPVGPAGATSYAQKSGSVVDSQPRLISNLIVDQTSGNPAAVAAAEFPVRTQNNPGKFPCTVDPDPLALPEPISGSPAGCVPSGQSLDIPNVTTDVGLSPPYNSLFTYFGQFFDHGVDQTVKGGGTVFVPLRADDPLIAGGDKKLGTADDLPSSMRFMVLTRALNQPGPDGVAGTADDVTDALNTDSPWIDQSQTYSSHASHQAFLREYAMVPGTDGVLGNSDDRPVPTGALLGGLDAGQTYPGSPDGRTGISTWAALKKQAATELGLLLTDADVTSVPMLAMDPYGNFVPGAHGLPQYVTADGLVEGDLANPVAVPENVRTLNTPFLTDIAHNADPSPVDTDHNPGTPPVAPAPDADHTASADFANQPAGTYDNEMLDAHFTCGDGRCNENIALSAIHQVFHSEHDRLVADIKKVLTTDTSAAGATALAQWKLGPDASADGWNGSRLFQAARFITEMEYQHAVFEDFGRKVQPAIRPFHVYSPDIRPAVDAEFAHAVYRFGHSMLNDTVARINVSTSGAKTDNSLPLLTAFLNPPEYFDGGGAGTLTPEKAAGSILLGSSDQIGNELDEFVTETLRNNLLGLPLDLATLNLTRARDAGVPPLNEFRRQLAAATNDSQLAPYTSWSDFGQHLRHPESLINFVAAYGTHPTIRDSGPDGILGNGDDVTTVAAKRAAAKLIVDPADPTSLSVPADAADFMFSAGAWAGTGDGVTSTGLDAVDLWIGGLAEVTNLNGGLLGSSFNYVFQNQMEKLQDGDRLYYLARTPGLNLRSQLEGNSFAELVERNTDGTDSLKADAFATADCRFQLGNLVSPAAAGSFITGTGSINDDATTPDCNENRLLLKQPNGTIQYRATNSVDPAGINGQSVFNGTTGVDRVNGGNDNDTFWGGNGNDVIEGNGGDDVALGGEGDDIITDLGGDDIHKGGPGDDAIDAGIGIDIVLGGDGQDFLNGGSNDNETFGGPDDDFIIAGQGADGVFGDGGDDWIQGGTGQDLLQGDHGAPFFDDPAQTAPGNDIFIGQPGENDYDAEGGDDLMAQNAAVDRNTGAGGFDWAFHQYDTVAADDDMEINNNLAGLALQVITNRDRWQETEADSGSPFNDVIKGTSVAPKTLGGGGFTGCDALDVAGVARISGLDQLVTSFPSALAPIVASSAAGACPLSGPTVWGEGDILIGGGGSDTLTGRGADDILDGDRFLQVRISVRTNPADPSTEIGATDLMEGRALTGTFGPGTTAATTLQQAVFAGLVDPGNLVATRTIVTPTALPADCAAAAPKNCDTAVFQGPSFNYSVTPGAVPGQVIVSQTGANIVGQKSNDGTDTLTTIERLQFTDSTTVLALPAAPTVGTATVTANDVDGTGSLDWTSGASDLALTGFQIRAVPVGAEPGAAGTIVAPPITDGTATSGVVEGLTLGTTYQLQVSASSALGSSPFSALSNPITPAAPVLLPSVSLTGTTPFPDTVIGTRTAAQTVTLTNTGPGVLTVSSVTLDGAGATSFGLDAGGCPSSVAAGAGCPLLVTFAPTSVGAKIATVVVTDNAVGSPHSVTLTGTGLPVPPAPVISNRIPAANATGVNPAGDVSASFSLAVTGVSTSTFTLSRGGTGIPAAVTQVGSTNQWLLNPTADLASNTVYTVSLTGSPTAIRSTAGVPLATTSWTFTTSAPTDITAPTVTASAPAASATVVAVGSVVTATFSEALNATTVSGTTTTLRVGTTATGTLVPAAVTYNAASRTLTLDPTANLAVDTRYTVRLSNGLRDVAGNALIPVTWSFLTGPAPTVTLSPSANATTVAVGTNLTGTFSEAVTGVTGTSVTLRVGTTATGALVNAVVSYNPTARVVTLNPNANLSPDTRYTIRLGTGITDLAGNPAVAASATFLTGPAPSVTARTPGINATGVGRSADVTATVSEAVVAARVSATSVTLRLGTAANGTLIAAVVSYNPTTRLITLNPTGTLAANTRYTVRLDSLITDTAGNPLPATSWTFTTGFR